MRPVVLAAFGLAACGQQPALPPPVPPSAPALSAPATGPSTPPPATGAAYHYRSSTLRNPFEPSHPGTVLATDGAQPDPHRPRTPLERFRLEELRLVGAIAAGGVRYALVADPGGTIRRVAVGDYLGTDHGRVTGLARGELTLREIVRQDGNWVWRPRSLVVAPRGGAEAAASSPPEQDAEALPVAGGEQA